MAIGPVQLIVLDQELDRLPKVTGPSGTFLGTVFTNSQSTTGGTADRRNNVEQVTLNAPAAGRYVLVVNRAKVGSVDAVNGDFGSFDLTLDEVKSP